MSKAAARQRAIARSAPVPSGPLPWFAALDRHARAVAVAAVLLATVRIAATWPVFSHTYDEPSHIAAGLEWLETGSYRWEPQHPPLARIAAAVGPWLLGRHTHLQPDPNARMKNDSTDEGLAILYEGHQPDRTLAAARAGVIPFFWVACFVVWEWSRRRYGERSAALAVAIFTFIPPVLGHAGVATTDMAVTAFTGAAFLAAMVWLERPDLPRSLAFGLATALAVLSKFSSLAFLPAAFAAVGAVAWLTAPSAARERLAAAVRRWPMFLAAVLSGAVVIWAAYRFSFHGVPAPELFQGIARVREHNQEGHIAYLLGKLSVTGWWYFFPVVLAYKTPLALWGGLLLWAGVPALRARWKTVATPLAFSGAILAVGVAANINLGLRHILPVYLGLSVAAAAATEHLVAEFSGRRWVLPVVGALALWLGAASLFAHPDYLPYFNELAGAHPEDIAVDSDLEWGQDVKRLAARARELDPTGIQVYSYIRMDPKEHGLPIAARPPGPGGTPTGWVAVDTTNWKKRFGMGLQGVNVVLWPDRIPPVEKVGSGFYLWHFPPAGR